MTETTIDLIVGSVGRLERLERLARSVSAQTNAQFRLIVVEQQDPAGARQILTACLDASSWILLESDRGLSRARNVGLESATSPIVGFPDDDCWYDPETLSTVVAAFAATSVDFVIGRQVSHDGRDVLRTPEYATLVDSRNVWRLAMSSAIFARRCAVDAAGRFDEGLGVGARTPYQSGEETDLVLSMIARGCTGTYSPAVIVRHPLPSEVPNRLSASTGRAYGRGMGRVIAKHSYPLFAVAQAIVRPALGSAVALAKLDGRLALFRLAVVRGRAEGYLATRQELRKTNLSKAED